MLEKIVLGTANFGMPYGVLNKNISLDLNEIDAIVHLARNAGINTFDTAYAYGSSLEILKNIFKNRVSKIPKIINKFSVKENYKDLLQNIRIYCVEAELDCLDALLIHDPNNISTVDIKNLKYFLDQILSSGLVKKVGVSVYDVQEVMLTHNILPISIIQCPINPLNQKFLQPEIKDFCYTNNIEVHGRSLFLQGVLLSNNLPGSLQSLDNCLKDYWLLITHAKLKPLEAVLQWANSQDLVNKWVIGVACLNDLQEIIYTIQHLIHGHNINKIDFDSLLKVNNPYADPRNWP